MKTGRDNFNKHKKLIYTFVVFLKIIPKKIRIKFFHSLRYTKGLKGIFLRYVFLKSILLKCGNNVSIHDNVYILNLENLSIGNNVSIHPMCYLECVGGLQIGNDVSIAHGVTIMTSEHNYSSNEIPIKYQEISMLKTVIKDNVWIGSKATILYGTILAYGTIIGASSVVTKSTEPNSIMVGVPAKKIKNRLDGNKK